jgi:hypothetical protein
MPRLAADAILDFVKKAKLSQEELTTILVSALRSTGVRSHIIYHLLVDLVNYHSLLTEIMKLTQFLEKLFISIIEHDCNFVPQAACDCLLILSNCDDQLFEGLNQTALFKKVLARLKRSSDTESIVLLLRMITQGGELKQNDVKRLVVCEDFLFTFFLRNIELGNSPLSVSLFLFLTHCIRYIKGGY